MDTKQNSDRNEKISADTGDAYRLSIDTPENVAFDYKVAGIGSRFLAALADTLLILVLQAIVYLTLTLMASSQLGSIRDWESTWQTWLYAIFGLIAFAFLWGYYVFFEVLWSGQSPGKRWAGLRVIRANGAPITLTESLIRNLIRLIDLLPVSYGIGIVAMFIDDQTRRLGDVAAGTLVVHDRAPLTLESLATSMAAPARARPLTFEPSTPGLPVERLTHQDIQMAEDFWQRRHQLANPTAIALRIARALLKRMDVSDMQLTGTTAQNLILKIIQASREREE